jgi:hypothetical protein
MKSNTSLQQKSRIISNVRLQLTGMFFIACLTLAPQIAKSQKDSIVFKNGNTMVGEIKSMGNGVLTVETPYSKNDFTIKWSEISKIFSQSRFMMTLDNGDRVNGTLNSVGDSGSVKIVEEGQPETQVLLDRIVSVKGLKSQFWSRVKASVDIGLDFTKANNLRQFSVRSAVGYTADRWQLDLSFNGLNSSQDSIKDTKRTDAGIGYKYFLQKTGSWVPRSDFCPIPNRLSNSEQLANWEQEKWLFIPTKLIGV